MSDEFHCDSGHGHCEAHRDAERVQRQRAEAAESHVDRLEVWTRELEAERDAARARLNPMALRVRQLEDAHDRAVGRAEAAEADIEDQRREWVPVGAKQYDALVRVEKECDALNVQVEGLTAERDGYRVGIHKLTARVFELEASLKGKRDRWHLDETGRIERIAELEQCIQAWKSDEALWIESQRQDRERIAELEQEKKAQSDCSKMANESDGTDKPGGS